MAIDALQLVYSAIDEVNAQMEDQPPIPKSPDTALLGNSGMDSLTFVNLISTIEQEIQSQTGRMVTVIDEKVFTQEEGPLRTVGTLASYLQGLLK